MRSRKIKSTSKNKPMVRREREPVPRKYIFLTGICGLILVIGFLGAARQHFASIDYGIKNAKLKKQAEELKSEQRRLQLNKEIALSPSEIKKSAKKIGFTEMTARNIQSFKAEKVSDQSTTVNNLSAKPLVEISLNNSAQELGGNDRTRQPETKKAVAETKKAESAEDKVKKS